jgi:hypothetical protein
MSNILGENSKVYEAARIQEEEELNKELAAGVPELKFNLAENLSFLLEHRLSRGIY